MIILEMMLEVVIGVLVIEDDKVTNMEVTNMMAKINNEDFSNMT